MMLNLSGATSCDFSYSFFAFPPFSTTHTNDETFVSLYTLNTKIVCQEEKGISLKKKSITLDVLIGRKKLYVSEACERKIYVKKENDLDGNLFKSFCMRNLLRAFSIIKFSKGIQQKLMRVIEIFFKK